MNPMTYWGFHALFTLPALVATLAFFLYQTRDSSRRNRQFPYVGWMAIIAFAYTTPWDNYLVKNEVWTYGLDRVSHVIGYVPIEEYAFFILQPIITGLLYLALRNRYANRNGKPLANHTSSKRIRIGGAVILLAVTGMVLLFRSEPYTYLRLIVGWSVPVLAGQWFLFGDYFAQRLGTYIQAIVYPTLFFSVADRIAIGSGVWDITAPTSTGVMLIGLPVEEFVFFLVTNVLVVQGMMLFVPSPKRKENTSILDLVRR